MRKKYLIGLAIAAVLALLVFGPALAEDLYIEGQRINPSLDPLIIDGEPYVVLYDVANFLQIPYDWSFVGNGAKVTLSKTGYFIDSPTIVNGNLLVSLDFLRDKMGLYVYWNQKDGRVIINRGIVIDQPYLGGDGLILRLETDKKAYKYGDPIALSLLVLNRSNNPLTLNFNSSQIYDITLKKDNRVVWSRSRDKAFLQAMKTVILNPLDFHHYVELIPARDLMAVGTGNFTLEANLVARNQRFQTEPISIQIRR